MTVSELPISENIKKLLNSYSIEDRCLGMVLFRELNISISHSRLIHCDDSQYRHYTIDNKLQGVVMSDGAFLIAGSHHYFYQMFSTKIPTNVNIL